MKKSFVALLLMSCLLCSSCGRMSDITDSTSADMTSSSITNTDNEESTAESTTESSEEIDISYDVVRSQCQLYTNAGHHNKCLIFVEIENTGNIDLDFNNTVNTNFEFEDDEGHFLTSAGLIGLYPRVISPGENGYFYFDLTIPSDVVVDNGFNMVYSINFNEDTETASYTDYEISDEQLVQGDSVTGPVYTCRVTNNSDEDSNGDYKTYVYLFDSENNLLCVLYSDTSIPAGQTIGVRCEGSDLSNARYVDINMVDHYTVVSRNVTYD